MSSPVFTAVTHNGRCARSLLSALLRSLQRSRNPSSPSPILLFAFAPSSTTPPDVLSDITSALTQLYPEHVGCISAPLPYQFLDPRIRSGPHSCSLAWALVNGVSFHSTIAGPAETQIGRWHAARQRKPEDASGTTQFNIEDLQIRIIGDLSESNGGQIKWDDIWDRTANPVTRSSLSRHGNNVDPETLPDALRNLGSSTVDNILYFSDKTPGGLATVLEGAFPQANKLSLTASSTPFITGRPVTLFYNGSILSNGAVGVAFTSPSSPPPVVGLSFPPLVALSTSLNVTSSEGNLILSLDSGNPTQLLLGAIQRHDLTFSHTSWVGKEDEFYVGVMNPSSQQISQLHRISAGDSSRGTIALDAASAPREGSVVRLYYLSRDPVPEALTYMPDTVSNTISLLVAPKSTRAASSGGEIVDDPGAKSDPSVVLNAFVAASENGFTLSRGEKGPWKCVVPGARMGLSWGGSTSELTRFAMKRDTTDTAPCT